MLQFWIPQWSFKLSGDIFLCSSCFNHTFFPLSVPDDISALFWSTLFSLSTTLTLAWAFAGSCSTYSERSWQRKQGRSDQGRSLLSFFVWLKLLPSVQQLSASQQLPFLLLMTFLMTWKSWTSNMTLSYLWMIFLIYLISPLLSANYVPEKTFWSISSNHSSCVFWSSMFSSSSWISTNILNIFSCCDSSLTAMPFWKEYIRSSISLDFLITLDTNFDLFFSSKAILYSFPFSVSLTYLFFFSSINGTAPILYTTSWMAPTFSQILSWPSHKTSGLFTLRSGVCTYPLELPSWYHLLCPSVSFLIPKFSILIRRLWASLDAPFNTIFPSLFDFPSADTLYPPVHFSPYTANVTEVNWSVHSSFHICFVCMLCIYPEYVSAYGYYV